MQWHKKQVSSSEKKIRLVFMLLYWYAENRLRVDLTVNEETEASYGPTLGVVHVRYHEQCLASRGNVIPIHGKTYSKQNQLETRTQYPGMRLRPSVIDTTEQRTRPASRSADQSAADTVFLVMLYGS